MKILIPILLATVNVQAAEWRAVGGLVEDVTTAPGWYGIRGEVIQVTGGKLLVRGEAYLYSERGYSAEMFLLITNFPQVRVDGDRLVTDYVKLIGNESYKSVLGAIKTVRLYDYGRPSDPPEKVLMEAEFARLIAADRAHLQREKRLPKLIAWERERAERGEASGQYALGLRYLNGDGVVQDVSKARELIGNAAAQGHAPAKRLLASLPPPAESGSTNKPPVVSP